MREPGFETRLIEDPGAITAVEPGWRALAESRSNAFVTPEWFRSWWRHLGAGSRPLIVAVYGEDELVGVVPLVLDESRRPHAVRFAGASFADVLHPAASEEDEDAVAAAAMAALDRNGIGRTMLMLENVNPEASWWRRMRGASSRRRAAVARQHNELTYISLRDVDWDWETYMASRSKNFRRRVRKREKYLNRDYEMRLRTSTEGTRDADMERFFELHAMRWTERGRSSLEGADVRAFLTGFAAEAQGLGWLRLSFLQLDGADVSAFLGWRVGRVYAFYQQGFDPAWSEQSPGFILATLMIREAMKERAEEFDFLLGTEDYKQAFSDAVRPSETLVLPKATSVTRVVVAADARARRAGRRIAAYPPISGVARSLAGLLPTSRAS